MSLKSDFRRFPVGEDAVLAPKISNSFCSYPWTGIQIHTTGELRPCCMMGEVGLHYKAGVSVREILNGPALREVRSQMLRGEKPSACRDCYDEDRLNIPSVRLDSPPIPAGTTADTELDLKFAEISFTNSCNLDCTMCRWEFSNKAAHAQNEFNLQLNRPEKIRSPKPFAITEADVESLIEQFRNVDNCRIIGGEPLMTKAGRRFIKLWADLKLPGVLDIVTNGTYLTGEVLADLGRCKNTLVNVSIDGQGRTYEWIRGQAWKPMSKILAEANESVRLILVPTVQFHNLMNLADLADFARSHKIRLRLGHSLRNPVHLSALMWPAQVREAAIRRLRGKWGEDKPDLYTFLSGESVETAERRWELSKWTEFMDRKRGFAWSAAHGQNRFLKTCGVDQLNNGL